MSFLVMSWIPAYRHQVERFSLDSEAMPELSDLFFRLEYRHMALTAEEATVRTHSLSFREVRTA